MPDPVLKEWVQLLSPFATALAIFVTGGIIVWWLEGQRNESEWFKSFRASHAEFWEQDEIAEVRKWISNPEAYEQIQPVLQRRAIDASKVTKKEYEDYLEKIDRFCALLHRVAHLDTGPLKGRRLVAWQNSYYGHWLREAEKRGDLASYIRTYWEGLFELRPAKHALPR